MNSARIRKKTEAGMKSVVLFGNECFLRRNIIISRTGRVLSKPRRCLSQPIMDSRSGAGCALRIGVWEKAPSDHTLVNW